MQGVFIARHQHAKRRLNPSCARVLTVEFHPFSTLLMLGISMQTPYPKIC